MTNTNQQDPRIAEAEAAIQRFIRAGIRPTVKSALCLSIVEEAIFGARNRPIGGIPSGHLYASLQGLLSLEEHYAILDVLKREKKIAVEFHLVKWIGGEVRHLTPPGPDVVYAPPAFKGQQSAKGATQARFKFVADRIAKQQTTKA